MEGFHMVRYNNTNVYSIIYGDRIYNIFDVINDREDKESCSYSLGSPVYGDNFIKVDIPIPNKLCTLKNNYKINDEAFIVTKYDMIRARVIEGNSLILEEANTKRRYKGSLYTLVPKNWWILHERCKSAMMEVSKCLLKCKIYKDVRVMIAKEIWKTCNDYEWDIFN